MESAGRAAAPMTAKQAMRVEIKVDFIVRCWVTAVEDWWTWGAFDV